MLLTLSIISFITAICFIIDRLISPKNVLASVERPKRLQRIVIEPGMAPVPCNVCYLPPTNPETEAALANVYVIFSGNPGAPDFYIDYMNEIRTKTKGNVHIYAIGHIYHNPLFNREIYDKYIEACIAEGKTHGKILTSTDIPFPRLDSQRISELPPNWEKLPEFKSSSTLGRYILQPYGLDLEPFNLQQTIAQKVAFIAQLRRTHPKSKFIISGHSMGSYCWLETLRTIERCYVYQHFNEAGLILWDFQNAQLTVQDVENEDIPIQIPGSPPHAVRTLEEKISSILFPPEQIAYWIDDLLIDVQAPQEFNSMGISEEDEQYNQLFFAHMTDQVKKHATTSILQFHGLMPTVMRIANTPNGHQLTPWFFRQHILRVAVKVISNIPGFMKRAIFNFPAPAWKYPDVNSAIRLLVNSNGLAGVVQLATDEMVMIRSLDINLVQRHAEKIFMYMSDHDEWAPKYQREYFQALNRHWIKSGLNTFKVQVDTEGAKHAFCFGTNEVVARHSLNYAIQCHPTFY